MTINTSQNLPEDNLYQVIDYRVISTPCPTNSQYSRYYVEFDVVNGVNVIFATPNNNFCPANGDTLVALPTLDFEIVIMAPQIPGPGIITTIPFNLGLFENEYFIPEPEGSINIWFWEFPHDFQVNGEPLSANNYSHPLQTSVAKKKRKITYSSMSSHDPINNKPGSRPLVTRINKGNIQKFDSKITKNKNSGKK